MRAINIISHAMRVVSKTKHSKTKHSKTKTEARSTQISKTKHPKLENEDPKSRKRRPQNLKLLTLVVDTIERVVSCENCSVRTFSYLLFEKS